MLGRMEAIYGGGKYEAQYLINQVYNKPNSLKNLISNI